MVNTSLSADLASSEPAPGVAAVRAGWRRRAILVGGIFQVAFGALWLARGLASFAPSVVAVTVGLAAFAPGGAVAVALRRSAPLPHGPGARAIERRLTIATALQLVASFVLPVVIGAVAGPRLVVPSILLTIGILLVWLRREVHTPYQGAAGWALIGLAGASGLFVGATQTAFAGIAAAAILLGCAAAGFGWLRRSGGRAA